MEGSYEAVILQFCNTHGRSKTIKYQLFRFIIFRDMVSPSGNLPHISPYKKNHENFYYLEVERSYETVILQFCSTHERSKTTKYQLSKLIIFRDMVSPS